MSFLHLPLIVAGGACVVVPVVLHLWLRSRPQHVVFPALRFVQPKQVVNRRQMRLQHWALLLLRCGALMLAAVAVARPVVMSAELFAWGRSTGALLVTLLAAGLGILAQRRRVPATLVMGIFFVALMAAIVTGVTLAQNLQRSPGTPVVAEEAPVHAVFLLDTAPHMGLQHLGKTRLDAARAWAQAILRDLPPDSRIAILGTQPANASFAIDLAAARAELAGLEISYVAEPITSVIPSALQLLQSHVPQEDAPPVQNELYVFSDLSRSAWPASDSDLLASDATPPLELHAYLLDVGVAEPRNTALGSLALSDEQARLTSEIEVTTSLQSLGLEGSRQVGLFVESPDPNLPLIVDGEVRLPEVALRDQREVVLDPNQPIPLAFTIRGLAPGTHHGRVQILAEDGLADDDVRHFAVRVRPAPRVLLIVGQGAESRFLSQALAPYELDQLGKAPFDCALVDQPLWGSVDWRGFDVVSFLDPQPLSAEQWQNLFDFVERGGGLAFFLGQNAHPPQSWNQAAADLVQPAEISRVWRVRPPTQWRLSSDDHPLLQLLRARESTIPWSEFPIDRHWGTRTRADSAQVLLRFGNGEPAVIGRHVGRGRVLQVLTPFSEPAARRARPAWNQGLDSWPFVVLANEMHKYLARGLDAPLNLLVGQPVRQTRYAEEPNEYQLFTPQGTWQNLVVLDGQFTIMNTEVPGAYRMKSTQGETVRTRGFALNLTDALTDVRRVDREALDTALGKDAYHFADVRKDLQRVRSIARQGHDVYGWGVLLLALFLGLEHLLANCFYATSGRR